MRADCAVRRCGTARSAAPRHRPMHRVGEGAGQRRLSSCQGIRERTLGEGRSFRHRAGASPPGVGETEDDGPCRLEHTAGSFSGAGRLAFPTDRDEAPRASFKPLAHFPGSPARDVPCRIPAPTRHYAPAIRALTLYLTRQTARTRATAPGRPRSSRDHAVHGLHRVRADATLIAVRAIVANPTAVDGGEQMNKADLVSHVAAETSVTRTTAERMVGAVVTAIGDALARGEPVAIAGFGKFATRSRAARRGRNPQTGEPVAIAASRAPSFKAAKALRDAVNA